MYILINACFGVSEFDESSTMPGKCHFQDFWLQNPEFNSWLCKQPTNKFQARCSLCNKNFDISSNSISSLRRHATGKTHSAFALPLQNGTQSTLNALHQRQNDALVSETATSIGESNSSNTTASSTNDQNPSSTVNDQTPPTPSLTANKHVVVSIQPSIRLQQRSEVTRAEIYWSISRVINHSSTRSAEKDTELFPLMFPDSEIASQMSMKKDKIAYTVTYGLGPHFQRELLDVIQKKKILTLSFDESVNKIAQKAQMDIIVRFWLDDEHGISTRYLASVFPNRCTAEGLLKTLLKAVSDSKLNFSNIIQLAMDGPNVNIKLYRDLITILEENDSCRMLNTSSCSLHIVHNAYKTAHNKTWKNIHKFLRSIYYLFKNFPTRRAEYTHLTKSELFPLKFCSVRWIENKDVITRALTVLPNLQKYVNGVVNNPPESNNYYTVSEALKSDLLEAKLHFMLSVNNELHKFLTEYQSDAPLIPFLHGDLQKLVQNIGLRFLSKSTFILKNVPKYLLQPKAVNIGFAASASIKKLPLVNQLRFKEECRSYLRVLFEHLLKKCPLNNNLIKGASCLSPDVLVGHSKLEERIDLILSEFVDVNIVPGERADIIKRELLQLSTNTVVKDILSKYSRKEECRLDHFYVRLIREFKDLFSTCTIDFIKSTLALFHGNAAVERSFSFNKECLVENLHEDSLIAQRFVIDHMKQLDFNMKKLVISKELVSYFCTSGTKRNEVLKVKRQSADEDAMVKKRMNDELQALEIKKKRLLAQNEEALQHLDSNIKYLQGKMKTSEL